MDVNNILPVLILGIVVLFVVLIIGYQIYEGIIEKQKKFTQIFSSGRLQLGDETYIEKLSCVPQEKNYKYDAIMKLTLLEPSEKLEAENNDEDGNLPFVVIAFLDDRTFVMGTRDSGNP